MRTKAKVKLRKKAKCWANVIANQIFVDHLYKRSLQETARRITLHSGVIKKFRAYLYLDGSLFWKKYGQEHEPDLRTGDETYGYHCIEQVENDLDYISDRFKAEFRLTWLLELPSRIEGLPETLPEETED